VFFAEADAHQRRAGCAPSEFRNLAALNLFVACGLLCGWAENLGTSVMAEDTQHDVNRRNLLLEAAREEMVKFERRENEFRRKDREERAAELRLPLGEIQVH